MRVVTLLRALKGTLICDWLWIIPLHRIRR